MSVRDARRLGGRCCAGASASRRYPSRTIAGTTGSWWPRANGDKTPWFQMFVNARKWARNV